MVVEGDLTGWSNGRRGRRVIKKANFGAARNLFGVLAGGGAEGRFGGCGYGWGRAGTRDWGAVQVVPALPLTPRHASLGGGEGRGAEAAEWDTDMAGTGPRGVVPAHVGMDGGCGCNCVVALAGVRREMVREIRKGREELMGAITLLLAERGLGTWEEERRLENTRGQLVKDRERAKMAHEDEKVAEKVKANENRRLSKARESEKRMEEAALRQEKERVAKLEWEREAKRNLEVAALTLTGAKTDEERLAACEAVVQASAVLKGFEVTSPAAPKVVSAGAWQAVGGVVTRRVVVVVRLNGPVGRERTAGLRSVVENVQMLVKESRRVSWNVSAVVWTEHAADEVLWRVTGVGRDISYEDVRKELVDDVTAVVGAGLVKDSWVEERKSRYVVVKGVPEAEWMKDGMSKLKGGGVGSMCGRRAPVVTSRVGKAGAARVSVKVEVVSR